MTCLINASATVFSNTICDQVTTKLRTRYGHYEFLVMLFGLKKCTCCFHGPNELSCIRELRKSMTLICVLCCRFCERNSCLRSNTTEGVCMDQKKITSIVEWRLPRTTTKPAWYYHRFVEGFTTIVAPLTKLLRKKKKRFSKMEQR
ncbi:Retrovirus-related Pol polyprotein from transposon 17.6 [Gossypium australe]|uniref:Retrovirus-related Pol polyprotein from transposon 17.6 n=1 Tax=Gossypium australe TaxID=47621 RepID=A0A5B6WYP0_9ROSI|nr:Retrovirus-related Pol polyprotein from transposon 17.6 [Gossypium australe]